MCLSAGFLANHACVSRGKERLPSPGGAAEQKCRQRTTGECDQSHQLQVGVLKWRWGWRQGLPTGAHTHGHNGPETPRPRDPTHLFHDDQISDLDVGALHLHGPCRGAGPRHITTEPTATPHVFTERPPAPQVPTASQVCAPPPAEPPPAPLRRDAPVTEPAPGTAPGLPAPRPTPQRAPGRARPLPVRSSALTVP